MKDHASEEILRSLRALAREESDDALADPRWDAVAAGAASEEDREALDRLIGEDDDLAAEARALFAPLGEDAQQRYALAIEKEIHAQQATAKEGARVENSATASVEPRRSADVVPLAPRADRRGARRIAMATAALAMAAAVALMVGRRVPTETTLPAYALTFTGGEDTQRGAPGEAIPRIGRGSRFVLTLRPATPVTGRIEARAFVVQGGRATEIPSAIQISADGAVRLSAQLTAETPLHPGDAEIATVIARSEVRMPREGSAAMLTGDDGRQVLRRAVRVVEAP